MSQFPGKCVDNKYSVSVGANQNLGSVWIKFEIRPFTFRHFVHVEGQKRTLQPRRLSYKREPERQAKLSHGLPQQVSPGLERPLKRTEKYWNAIVYTAIQKQIKARYTVTVTKWRDRRQNAEYFIQPIWNWYRANLHTYAEKRCDWQWMLTVP